MHVEVEEAADADIGVADHESGARRGGRRSARLARFDRFGQPHQRVVRRRGLRRLGGELGFQFSDHRLEGGKALLGRLGRRGDRKKAGGANGERPECGAAKH